MKIEVTVKEITRQEIVDILCSSNAGISYWNGELYCREEIYDSAKKDLEKPGREKDYDSEICFEDVWGEVLLSGEVLTVHDGEEDTEHDFDLKDFVRGAEYCLSNGYMTADPDDWDATTSDNIIQAALYGEILYA